VIGCLLVEKLLDVICKDLDQGSMSGTSMLRYVLLFFMSCLRGFNKNKEAKILRGVLHLFTFVWF